MKLQTNNCESHSDRAIRSCILFNKWWLPFKTWVLEFNAEAERYHSWAWLIQNREKEKETRTIRGRPWERLSFYFLTFFFPLFFSNPETFKTNLASSQSKVTYYLMRKLKGIVLAHGCAEKWTWKPFRVRPPYAQKCFTLQFCASETQVRYLSPISLLRWSLKKSCLISYESMCARIASSC